MNCPNCKQEISPEWFYCPTCGKKLKDKPVDMKMGGLVKLYLLSLLLPPFGLGLTTKYIRSTDAKAKIAGWISLLITVGVLILVSSWSAMQMVNLTQELNSQVGTLYGW